MNGDLYDIIGATLRTHDTSAVVPFLLFIHPTLDTHLQHMIQTVLFDSEVKPGGPT